MTDVNGWVERAKVQHPVLFAVAPDLFVPGRVDMLGGGVMGITLTDGGDEVILFSDGGVFSVARYAGEDDPVVLFEGSDPVGAVGVFRDALQAVGE